MMYDVFTPISTSFEGIDKLLDGFPRSHLYSTARGLEWPCIVVANKSDL